jgi:hypothetical protein
VIALAVILVSVATPSPAQARRLPGELLPDLETREPRELVIDFVGGQKVLRFSNEVANHSTGVMEVYPARGGDCDGDGDPENNRLAYQRIYRDANGNGAFNRGIDPENRTIFAGCMEFHPTHNHWHFEDFADYRLYHLNPDGTRGGLADDSRKTSFCIGDFGGRLFPELPGASPTPHYGGCDQMNTQGLSVGWSDVYQYYLDGQHVVLPNTRRGLYCLVSVADPGNRLLETDETDNAESIKVVVSGTWVGAQPGSNC